MHREPTVHIVGRAQRATLSQPNLDCLSGLSGAPTSLNLVLLMTGSHQDLVVKSRKRTEHWFKIKVVQNS